MTLAPLLLAIVSLGQPAEPAEKVFVGYLYGPPGKLDFKLYTHICHAFVTANADGTIQANRLVPNRKLVDDAHQAGVRVLLSLGGWGWDANFAAMAKNTEAEDRYCEAVLALVRDNGYDGIDLDWEYPDTKAEVEGFERLVKRLRAGLDAIAKERGGKRLELTMAASANPGTLRWLKSDFLQENMDWINVMTYDMAGDWTDYAGHNAPLFPSSKQPGTPLSASTTIEFLLNEHKLPADKIALGIPLYGRGFPVAEPYASTKGAPKTRVPGGNFRGVESLLKKGWTREWDDQTKTPWLRAPDGKAVIGYDDPESVSLKAAWAKDKNLRGVFFWEINADRMPDGTHPLQDSARKSLFPQPK